MKKLSLWVCIIAVFGILLPLGAGAVTVTTQSEAQAVLEKLEGDPIMDFQAYQDGVAKTNNDQILFQKVTGADGLYSSYIRAQVLSAGSSSTSRQLLYRSLSGISAGDSVLLSFVMRSAGGTEGKGTVTLMATGASSSANKSFSIPTQWTRIYIPLTAKDAANITTFRLHTLAQTIDIADFQVINYGTDVLLSDLPSGSHPVDEKEEVIVEGLTGGTQITLDDPLYTQAVKAERETLRFTAPQAVPAGNMALLCLDVKAMDSCATATVSFGQITKEYAIPVQWSRIYMPVQTASDLSGAQITVNTGTVLLGDISLENMGSATFEELTLKSGMWLLEDFQDVALAPEGVGAGKNTDLVISPDGNYVYSIGGGNFTVTDISDPENPEIVKQLTGFGDTRQIALCADGEAVIFTCRLYGAYIVDVSDPINAHVRSHYDTLEMATGIAVYKNYAFICSRFYGVEVVDLSDLDAPIHKCIIRNGGEVQSVEVVDGYLYGGLYNTNQVEIYDVRDPVNYARVGVADLNGRGDGVSVAKIGDKTYLYAGTGHHSVAGLATTTPLSNLNYGDGNGLDIFDVTDPSNPVWLSTSRTDGRFYHTKCDYWGAQVSFDEETGKYYAYLVSTYNGIYVFDVTDPAAPLRIAHVAVRITPDSALYAKPSSTRAIAFQYDPTQYIQGPAGAVVCADGVLMYAGVETDLHVLTADYAHAHVEKPASAAIESDFNYYHFDDFAGAQTAVPNAQTASVALYGDKVFVSGGNKGILIYSADLQTLYKTVSLSGCSYDVFIQDGKLYSAEGTDGFAIYALSTDGLTLTEITRYRSGCVTMARPSVTGKYVSIHSGATVGEIVDVSGQAPVRMIRAAAASQMYHHNVSSGMVAGRYVGFWANSSSERWYDLGGNDSLSAPVLLSNIPAAGFTPRAAMTGGYVAYGNTQVLCVGNGGYYVYDPAGVTASDLKALKTIKATDSDGNTVNVYGKPAIYGDTLILSDRIYGRLYILDIQDIEKPVLLKAWQDLPGNPDAATFSGNYAYIPLGYQGIVRLDLTDMDVDPNRHFGGSHCACGGHAQGMEGHSCTDLAWKAWSDPDSLPASGNYYLVCDVNVSQQTALTGRLNLCLHGHSITATGTDRIYYSDGKQLHITDCREKNTWGSMVGSDISATYPNDGGAIFYGKNSGFRLYLYAGSFVGGTAARGGVAYVSGGQIHIYGGTLAGGTATKMGGNLYANTKSSVYIHGGTVKNGISTTGAAGNIYMNVNSTLSVSGGEILGGSAKTDGGNISLNGGGSKTGQPGAVCYITGGRISGGTADRNGGSIYCGGKSDLNEGSELYLRGGSLSGGSIVSNHRITLAVPSVEASLVLSGNSQLSLEADSSASVKLTGTTHLMLNGHTLTGNVTGTGTLYGMDSSSDTYTLPTGRIEGAVSCQMPVHFKTDITGQPMRYMTIADETGYTFHRFYLGLTKVTLRPNSTGFGYKAQFCGDAAVQALVDSFGFQLQLDGQNTVLTQALTSAYWDSQKEFSLVLQNYDIANFGETKVHSQVFLNLKDGTAIESGIVSYSMMTMLQKVCLVLNSFTEDQIQSVKAMCQAYVAYMENWDIDELIAA